MKTTITNHFAFDLIDARLRAATTAPRHEPQITPLMKKLTILFLLMLLGAATPPLLQAQTTETYTFTTNRLVPDGNPSGLSEVRTLNSAIGNITSMTVHLKTTGEFNGDLYGYVTHASGFTVLLNRPGETAANPAGYADSGFDVTFQDSAANGDIHLYQNKTTPAAGSPLTGTWQPDDRNVDPATVLDTSPRTTALANFNGLNAAGQWTLFLADLQSGGTNELTEWSLTIVGQVYPTLAWANPAGIVYGTALGASQLNATATYDSTNVPGTFTYTPAAGTILNAGSGQTLSVTFTPTDTTTFLPVTTNVTINVAQAAPVITWANPAGIVYGTALSGTQLDATANVPGAFVYSPVAGTVLHAGSGQTLSATFTPTDTTDYTTATPTVTINVAQAAPVITWANPAGIVYGTALSGTQLDATANVPGAFVYSPVAGTVLHAGSGQTLSATFTPTDTTDYTTATPTVTINVAQAAPVITWGNPAGIVYGTALSGTQLDATANIPGAFVYSPVAGTVLHAGSGQTLSATFTPTDTTDYTTATPTVTINVAQANTTGVIVSSSNPALPGANVTFTVTVSPVPPGVGAPSGTVNFRVNGSIGGAGTLSGGVAAFATNSLPHGSNTVVAEYAGDQNFAGITNSLAPAEVINTPPMAGNLTIQRYPTLGVKVSLATILASCSDADGDALNITPSSTSANGGAITVADGWVFYAPAEGFTNADSFTYTVTDGYGGSAVGTITVAIAVDASAGQNLTITSLGNGSYLINGAGIPGYTYRVQHSPTINPANWQDIPGASVTAGSTGAFQYTDTPSGGMGFYRTIYP